MARTVKKAKKKAVQKSKKVLKKACREKKRYNQWDCGRLKSALEEYTSKAKEGTANLRMIARAWDIPKSTLQRRLKGSVLGTAHCSGRKPLLSEAAKKELASVIELLASRGFPLGMKEVRDIAYQYSEKNNLNVFTSKHKEAGYYWFTGFLQRHPQLRIRKPEALSAARAMAMNKPVIDKWFTEYENLLTTLGIKDNPSHIWNCDETGLVDHFERRKAVGTAGHACYQITANERGETTTVLACFNGTGDYAPVLFVFKGSRLQAKWCVGAPLHSLVRMSPNGWITSTLFAEWGAKFVANLPKDHLPHLLLLDGHASHVYNLDFLNMMQANNVHIFCFPPHCSHWLQPADKSLFKSVKHHWNEAGWKKTKESGGARIQRDEFFSLFASVWPKAATVETAQNGFRATGLFPVNRTAIPETAFAPSLNTDRQLHNEGSSEEIHQLAATSSQNPSSEVTIAAHTSTVSAGTDNVVESNPVVANAAAHFDTDTTDAGNTPVMTSAPSSTSVTASTSCSVDLASVETTAASSDIIMAAAMNTGGSSFVSTDTTASQTPVVNAGLGCDSASVVTTAASSSGGVIVDKPGELPGTGAEAYATFASLVHVPHRERKSTARKRSTPPSYNLTSTEHLSFVSEKLEQKEKSQKKSVCTKGPKKKKKSVKKPQKKEKKVKLGKLNKKERCRGCGVQEGTAEDIEMQQDWIACELCKKWYHEQCAEENGVLDDDYFSCKICIA